MHPVIRTILQRLGLGLVTLFVVSLILFSSIGPIRQIWQDETVFSFFNLYRGDLARLREFGEYTQEPTGPAGGNPNADRFCGILANFENDNYLPNIGEVVYYFVTGESAGIEFDLGVDSSGNPRVNLFPCP